MSDEETTPEVTDEELAAQQPNTAGDSLIAILDELVATVEHGRGVPMSASVMVNRSEVLDLLTTARDIVPDQIHAADSIMSEAGDVRADAHRQAKAVIAQAHADAETIIEEARAQAVELTSNHEITQAAHAERERIISDAREQADKLGHGANTYSDNVLASLQSTLETALSQVSAGRSEIARRSDAQMESGEPDKDTDE